MTTALFAFLAFALSLMVLVLVYVLDRTQAQLLAERRMYERLATQVEAIADRLDLSR